MRRSPLVCHPDSACPAVRRLEASVTRSIGGTLDVSFLLEGDLARLRVPPFRSPVMGDRLWEHTCFEVFVRRRGAEAYHELNLAPSGAWAAYAFERYREGRPLAKPLPEPAIAVRRDERTLELVASIRLADLSAEYVEGDVALALSAVIEDDAGALSYWALAHPAAKPDFHHPDGFVYVIPARGGDPGAVETRSGFPPTRE
jgi:hypothetical protein